MMTPRHANAIDRRSFLIGGTAAAVTTLTGCQSAEPVAPDPFLDGIISVDTHAHPGSLWRSSSNVPGALDRIMASDLTAFAYSVPTDSRILTRDRATRAIITARAPRKGELYGFAKSKITDGIDHMKEAGIAVALSPADIVLAKQAGQKACLLALEGGGFAEDRLEAIEEMHGLGVRIIQPVHYNVYSPIGDVQGQSEKGGLTGKGIAFVKELDRLGIVLDAAHMTSEGVAKAAAATAQPMILSHVLYARAGELIGWTDRFVSPRHAEQVVETGGLLGVWNLSSTRMARFFGYDSVKAHYLDTFRRLADTHGVDHLCLGTDLGSTRGWFNSYAMLPALAGELRGIGFENEEIAKIFGGNFMRVFRQVTSPNA